MNPNDKDRYRSIFIVTPGPHRNPIHLQHHSNFFVDRVNLQPHSIYKTILTL